MKKKMTTKDKLLRLTLAHMLKIRLYSFLANIFTLFFSNGKALPYKASINIPFDTFEACQYSAKKSQRCRRTKSSDLAQITRGTREDFNRAETEHKSKQKKIRIHKTAALLVFLLLTAPLLAIPMTPATTNPVYFSVEPITTPPLTNINASVNGLETPATPSPVSQNFTVAIHLAGATTTNVPNGVAGIEVHLFFGNMLNYCQPTGFTDYIGQTNGVLGSGSLEGLPAGFYLADSVTRVGSAPYTGAVYFSVAAASTSGGWNGNDGLVAVVNFTIIKQPQSSSGEPTVTLPLNIDYTDLEDALITPITHDTIQGTVTIDATPGGTPQAYSLTVNAIGNGTITQNPQNATYTSGTNVTLTANPSPNSIFAGWSGDVTGTQNPVTFTMSSNKTVTATFTQIIPSANYTLTVDVIGNGTVAENPLNATYASGTNVTLTAVPGSGSTFTGWSGDVTGTQNPAITTMDSNKTVTATFVSQASGPAIDVFTQKVPFNGMGPNQSSDAFQQQELVILYALVTFGGDPIANKVVAYQVMGPPNSLQNLTILGTGVTNASGIAVFSFRVPTAPINGQQEVFGKWLVIATVDVDQVTVVDTLTFPVGWIVTITSIVTLNEKLVPQTTFALQDTVVFNLTLDCIALTPKDATITVNVLDVMGNLIMQMQLDNVSIPPGLSYLQTSSQIPTSARIGEANASATAYTASPSSGGVPYSPSVYTAFNIVTTLTYYTLTVNVVGNGTVTQLPGGNMYINGTTVTLIAVPGLNWTFAGWTGDLTGTQNPAAIVIDGNEAVTVTFIQYFTSNYVLKINVIGNGTVTENPAFAVYSSGTSVALTANAGSGWIFLGWTGDLVSSQNPATIAMDSNKTVTAIFEQANQYYFLTVNVIGNGTVTQNPLTPAYAAGTVVTLTASPDQGWSFAGWSGDVTGTQTTITVIMNRNLTVTATFLSSVGIQDVAILNVKAAPTQVSMGQPVEVLVLAANLGDFRETFDVTTFYDLNIIQVIHITSMAPHTTRILTVIWNTANVSTGTYTISANATIVEGDVNPANNNFIDGQVTITSAPLPSQLSTYSVILILGLLGFAGLGGITTLILLTAHSQTRRKRRTRRRYMIVSHPQI